eukprot:scaffold4590_cov112-Cylindrotheca_fusiformis.AAC.10
MMMRFYARKRAMEEQESRRNKSTTFTEPLRQTPDMRQFLADFYKKVYTDPQRANYRKEQEKYPILKSHFDVLVPDIISYEDFWQRYDYRCDFERILNELKEDSTKSITTPKPKSNPSISISLGNLTQRFMDMASDATSMPMSSKTEDNQQQQKKSNQEGTQEFSKETKQEEEEDMRPKPEVIEDLLAHKDEHDDERRPIALRYLEATEGSSGVEDDGEAESESTAKHSPPPHSSSSSSIHVYPERPEEEDNSSHRNVQQQRHQPDDRLVGTAVYLLNDIDEEVPVRIESMGGSITSKLEEATHALWIPNPVTEYTSCPEALMASSLNIPIVDGYVWLHRMSKLKWDEHWSDVHSLEFLPVSTNPLPSVETELIAPLVAPKQHVRRARGIMRLLIVLLALILVLAYMPSIEEEYCQTARPHTFLALFCGYCVDVKLQQENEVKTTWWKKIVPKRKQKGKPKKGT